MRQFPGGAGELTDEDIGTPECTPLERPSEGTVNCSAMEKKTLDLFEYYGIDLNKCEGLKDTSILSGRGSSVYGTQTNQRCG